MSDETPPTEELTPNADVLQQLREAGDAAMPALLARLRDAVDGHGKVTKRIRCTACGELNTVEVEVADVEESRKLVEMFANLRLKAQAASKGDEGSERATRLLRDRSDLTDAELAEYIASLEAELDAAR